MTLDELIDLDSIEHLTDRYVPYFKYVYGAGVRHKAMEMGVSSAAAKKMRLRYVIEQLHFLFIYMDNPDFMGVMTPLGEIVIPYGTVDDLLREIEVLTRPEEPDHDNTITESMRETAKMYPVNQLLDFRMGKIRCINPNHEDKNPTMFYGNRVNRAVCPACQKKYDSIEILQITEGITFAQAVRNLCSR
jgi:hypothetical protein